MLALFLAACGNDGGGIAAPPLPATYYPRFGFVANQGDDTLSVYVINAATGQWLHNGYLPTGADPVAVAVSPNEKFVFVVDETDNNISVFQLDAVTGRLSFVETENTGAAPSAVAVSPSGSWLYAANTGANTISGYSRRADIHRHRCRTRRRATHHQFGGRSAGCDGDAPDTFPFVCNQQWLEHGFRLFL